jgi:hypothetical protein
MSKKLAEITTDDSVLINNSIEDLFNDDEDVIIPQNESDNENEEVDNSPPIVPIIANTEVEVEEEVEESNTEETEKEEKTFIDDDYKDYNNVALLALSLKEQSPDLVAFDINKDLNPAEFVNLLQESVRKKEEDFLNELEKQYGAAAVYLNHLVNGGDPDAARTGMQISSISNIEIDGTQTEEELETIVQHWLLLTGTPSDTIDDLIEVYKDKGILNEKAEESVKYHKTVEKEYIDRILYEREQENLQRQRYEQERKDKLSAIINKGVVKSIPIKDTRKLYSALFDRTETVNGVDNQGRNIQYKERLIDKKLREVMADPEKELAIMELILNDFDFSQLENIAKNKVNKNLVDVLNNRLGSNQKSNSKYFDD